MMPTSVSLTRFRLSHKLPYTWVSSSKSHGWMPMCGSHCARCQDCSIEKNNTHPLPQRHPTSWGVGEVSECMPFVVKSLESKWHKPYGCIEAQRQTEAPCLGMHIRLCWTSLGLGVQPLTYYLVIITVTYWAPLCPWYKVPDTQVA